MKKRIALLAILVGCLFAAINLNTTSVSADFDDVSYEEVDVDWFRGINWQAAKIVDYVYIFVCNSKKGGSYEHWTNYDGWNGRTESNY